jgi:hypothetical protein
MMMMMMMMMMVTVRGWRIIRENIKVSATEGLGYYDVKQYKPWFHKKSAQKY